MSLKKPSIDPVILSIGFVEIRWYSLAYILGFLLGIYIIKRLNKIYGNQYSNKEIDSFLIWSVLGVIIGGRTGYVIFYQLNEFLTNPFYLFEKDALVYYLLMDNEKLKKTSSRSVKSKKKTVKKKKTIKKESKR